MRNKKKTIAAAATAMILGLPAAGWTATFKANLVELNNSGVSGSVTFVVNEALTLLTVSARIMGLEPNALHINHVHGRFNEDGTPKDSILPTADLDTDKDGFVEVLEALPNYGDILLSLEPSLALPSSDPSKVHTGPISDASGNLSYDLDFDLTDDAVFFSPVSRVNYTAADLFPLFLREYVVHGQTVPDGVRQDGEGNLLPAGYDATLPVAAAELSPVPLPATGLLLMGGLGFLGTIRKRRRAAV